jgi:hypothetical protein
MSTIDMSPMARSKLGLTIARTAQTFNLARPWQGSPEESPVAAVG